MPWQRTTRSQPPIHNRTKIDDWDLLKLSNLGVFLEEVVLDGGQFLDDGDGADARTAPARQQHRQLQAVKVTHVDAQVLPRNRHKI